MADKLYREVCNFTAYHVLCPVTFEVRLSSTFLHLYPYDQNPTETMMSESMHCLYSYKLTSR